MRGLRWRWLLTITILLAASAVAIGIAVNGRTRPPATPPSSARSAGSTLLDPVRLAGALPIPREGAAMAYDAARRQVVLFGGTTFTSTAGSGAALIDTWTFQGRTWTRMNPQSHPGPMARDVMVYDSRSRTSLLIGTPTGGAGPAQTWSWDGAAWARLTDVPLTALESFSAAAYDPSAGQVLLVTWLSPATNSSVSQTHTWTWDGRAWSLHPMLQSLPVSSTPRLSTIGDIQPDRLGRGVLAVLGGAGASTQTWMWDGNVWSQRASGGPPDDPFGIMAEDPTTQVVVLMVGQELDGPGTTWLWDGSAWHQGGAPPSVDSLYGGTWLLSDSAYMHVIVIGDSGRPNRFDVLWTFEGTRWVSDTSA